jgi:hypothetical protein
MRVSKILFVSLFAIVAAAFFIMLPTMAGAEDPWAENDNTGGGNEGSGSTPTDPEEGTETPEIPEGFVPIIGEDNPFYGTPYYWWWLLFGGGDNGDGRTDSFITPPVSSGSLMEENQTSSSPMR